MLLLTVGLGGGGGISDFVVTDVFGKVVVVFVFVVGAGTQAGALVGGVLAGPVTMSTAATPVTGVVMSVGTIRPGAPTWRTLGPRLRPTVPVVGVHEVWQLTGWRRGSVVNTSAAGCVGFWVVHGFPEGIVIVWPSHYWLVVVWGCVCVCVSMYMCLVEGGEIYLGVCEVRGGCWR